ncbi:unnamed protein product, partial [Symbiodinium sp. KB8]
DQTKFERAITPGPGEYVAWDDTVWDKGGTWGRYASKSDLELRMERAAAVPGPGAYRERRRSAIQGGTWGKYSGLTALEEEIQRAEQLPGVGDYEPLPLTHGPHIHFAASKTKNMMEQIIDKASQLP